MYTDSFDKGEQFEKFVLDRLFQSSHYDLVHRTNTTSQNQYRFVENSLKPDFKFRCKRTKREFYVEAKYRSDFNQFTDKIEVMQAYQFERYLSIQKAENIPVYIAVGYQGSASYPGYISLIPLLQLQYLEAFPSFLKKFNIPKNNVNSETLNLLAYSSEVYMQPRWKETKNYTTNKKYLKNDKPKPDVLKYSVGLLLLLAFIVIGMRIYPTGNITDTLRNKTEAYYQTLEMNRVEDLDNYVNSTVEKWYNKNNLTLDEVKVDAYQYIKKFPQTKTEILWNTFEVTPLNDDHLVTYELNHQVFSKRLKNRIYHLKIRALWGENLKLKGIYEDKE